VRALGIIGSVIGGLIGRGRTLLRRSPLFIRDRTWDSRVTKRIDELHVSRSTLLAITLFGTRSAQKDHALLRGQIFFNPENSARLVKILFEHEIAADQDASLFFSR